MMSRRRPTEASIRQAERRQREDEAPRLATAAPELVSLRLEIEELRDGGRSAEGTYSRPIQVATAPALFEYPCGDRSCKDGGHDFTRTILSAVKAKETKFEGEDSCQGSLGSSGVPCRRTMHIIATASYQP